MVDDAVASKSKRACRSRNGHHNTGVASICKSGASLPYRDGHSNAAVSSKRASLCYRDDGNGYRNACNNAGVASISKFGASHSWCNGHSNTAEFSKRGSLSCCS